MYSKECIQEPSLDTLVMFKVAISFYDIVNEGRIQESCSDTLVYLRKLLRDM